MTGTTTSSSPSGAFAWTESQRDFFAAAAAVETAEYLSQNYRWIITVGVWNVLLGMFCLTFPMFATQVAELTISWTILLSGVVLAAAGCYQQASDPQQSQLVMAGAVQMLLGSLMLLHPMFTLAVLTLLVAFIFMIVGTAQISAAATNLDSIGTDGSAGTSGMSSTHRFMLQVSGVLAVVMSVVICLALPLAQFYTIGVLLGTNLINIGVTRIGLGCHGRQIAKSNNGGGEYSTLLPS